MNPLPVRAEEQRAPTSRMQNVPLDVTPDALEDFDYYAYSVATGQHAVYLSVWGFPWWTGEGVSAPKTGGFSMGFGSGFEGGVGSPQGAGFSTGFNSGFGS